MVQYHFFGGKGGVGKTTCAAAFAVAAARAGRRALLVSTDPAPSAGDALGQPLSSSPRPVKGVRGPLHALEIDSAKVLARWLGPRRPLLEAIALRGTWLDQQDVTTLLRLSLPGIDEIAGLMEIGRLGRSERYDMVVVDTAPTGHTLRMLGMPDLLRTLAAVFDRMQTKHRAMVEALRGRWTPEATDALIASLDDEGSALAALLRDRRRTAMSWVTLPEPLAIAETLDALDELRRLDIHVDSIVVNRVTAPPPGPCRWCQARRRFERQAVDPLLARFTATSGPVLSTIAARAREPRGVTALAHLAAEMAGAPRLPKRGTGVVKEVTAATRRARPLRAARDGGRLTSLGVEERLSLVMFGGKGGVGKTTCAAAAAIAAADEHPGRPVLLLSSDPAHSLADVLGVPLGDEPRAVTGARPNLRARELDALKRLGSAKERYRKAIDALFERLVRTSALDVSADHQAMRDLMDLAPPGLDELVAIVEVSEALEPDAGADTLVVLDTAPTGHALRLLEMPAIVHDWVKALMAILLKYQPVVGVGELGEILLHMSQGLTRLRARLADPSRTGFLAVTRPATLPMAETRRLLKRLRALRIHVPGVVVNAVGAGTCARCVTTRREQQRALEAIRTGLRPRGSRTLIVAPGVVPPPHGPAALRKWRKAWEVD